jgi:hypothetical protein
LYIAGIATQTILTIPVNHVTSGQMVNLALSNGQVVTTTLANLQTLAQPHHLLAPASAAAAAAAAAAVANTGNCLRGTIVLDSAIVWGIFNTKDNSLINVFSPIISLRTPSQNCVLACIWFL